MGKISDKNEYDESIRKILTPVLNKLDKEKLLNFSYSYELSKAFYLYVQKMVFEVLSDSHEEKIKFLDAYIRLLESDEMQEYLKNDEFIFLDIVDGFEISLYLLLMAGVPIYGYESDKNLKPFRTSPFPLSQLHCIKGFTLRHMDRYEEAIESYKKALNHNFMSENINYYYCEACILAKKYELLEDGLKNYYRFMRTEKLIFNYYIFLGKLCIHKNEFDKALVAFTIAKRIGTEVIPEEDDAKLKKEYGDKWDNKLADDSKDLSLKYFNNELVYFPTFNLMWNNADILFKEGRYDDALKIYSYINPYFDNVTVKLRIAECLAKLNEKTEKQIPSKEKTNKNGIKHRVKVLREKADPEKWNDRNTLCRFCINSIYDIDKANADKNCKKWKPPKSKPLSVYISDKEFFCSHFDPNDKYEEYIKNKTEESSNVDTDRLTEVINEMYPGIQMFVRDVNLNDKCFDKYKVGMIIKEKGFTDASTIVMGMKTKHRFTILSNHMADFSSYEHGTNWDLHVAQHDSHFKVLDIYTYHDKTQILLLHLPDNDDWKLFINTEVKIINKDLVEMCRQKFEMKCDMEVAPELATEQWLQRCEMPIGMDINGKLFNIK